MTVISKSVSEMGDVTKWGKLHSDVLHTPCGRDETTIISLDDGMSARISSRQSVLVQNCDSVATILGGTLPIISEKRI